ncbi:MAG: hypothetical protein KDC83_03940 [Flavobacteriales bacterium]|nr:hypothetical protein [Flavobacteriales bacterium]
MNDYRNSQGLRILITAIFVAYGSIGFSQLFELNKSTEVLFGTPVTVTHFSAVEDGNGNLYHLGTTFNSQEKFNLLLTKFNENNNIEWEIELDNASRNDYGVSICLSPMNDIIISGATVDTLTDTSSIILASIDINGNVNWQNVYNPLSSLHSYPTKVICDNKNYFF